MSEERVLCTFRVAEHLLGLDISVIQEVLRQQEITRLPLAAPAVRGVINLRGRIVPALDLRRCLDLPVAEGGRHDANIVAREREDAPVSLLVDEIGDVVTVPLELCEGAPETMRAAARELIRGVFPVHDRLLLELDLGKVLRVAYA